jgi:hypothetical protein
VAPDHGDDDGAPKSLKLVVIHLQRRPHLAEGFITPFLRQQRQIPTELSKRKCPVHLVRRAVSLIEQRLREGGYSFCNGSHRVSPYGDA